MRITVHVKKFYDWEPVPPGTKVTEKDVAARRVKPSGAGGWLMRVQKNVETHTDVGLPEAEIIAMMIAVMTRDHEVLTRHEAVARYLAQHVMPHHAHRTWMKDIELHDDGRDDALFAKLVAAQVEAGNIEPESAEEMAAAYADDAELRPHLCKHFKIAPPAPKNEPKNEAP